MNVRQVQELIEEMTKAKPGALGIEWGTVEALFTATRVHHHVENEELNKELDESQRQDQRNREARIVRYAQELGAVEVSFGGDPRGNSTVSIIFPSGVEIAMPGGND